MSQGLQINADRLWDSIMEMAKIDATEKGGNCRLALSDGDKAGRDLFVSWCEDAGMTCTVDKMGNIFARRPGSDPDAPPVSTGSHLDTQPTGGKFDGVYGVLAGLEVARTLNEAGIKTRAPLEVICWTNEEGARFAPAMVGSGVFAGAFDLAYGHGQKDVDGKTMGEELARIGYLGPEEPGGHKLGAHFEAHIEQGPILEAKKKPVGVVTGVRASAGTMSRSRAWRPMPARHRWTCATMPWSARPSSSCSSTPTPSRKGPMGAPPQRSPTATRPTRATPLPPTSP